MSKTKRIAAKVVLWTLAAIIMLCGSQPPVWMVIDDDGDQDGEE